MKTIMLSGSLARLFGRTHRLEVSTPAEAIRALCATRPGFEKYLMNAKDRGIVFTVFTGRRNIEEEELTNPVGKDIIRFIPVLAGSKKAGVLNIIVGVVLIAVGVVVQYWMGGDPSIAQYFYGAGISMIVGGVVQMLTPVPKNQDRKDDARKSYVFNGAVNVQAQGNPVPLLYGELIVGSAVISAGISSQDNYISGNRLGPVNGGHNRGGGHNGDVLEQMQ